MKRTRVQDTLTIYWNDYFEVIKSACVNAAMFPYKMEGRSREIHIHSKDDRHSIDLRAVIESEFGKNGTSRQVVLNLYFVPNVGATRTEIFTLRFYLQRLNMVPTREAVYLVCLHYLGNHGIDVWQAITGLGPQMQKLMPECNLIFEEGIEGSSINEDEMNLLKADYQNIDSNTLRVAQIMMR